MERRIAAILAADMVTFSRLVELDEAGTLERQKRHRVELIDPAIEQHGGTVIKLTGDGMLAEFASVVEAVQAAVHVQKEMVEREANVPEDRRIRYRIAVHLGDIIFDEGDIYGDGVNVAARLEGLAEPGGVVVSGPVHDMLKAQVDVGYRSLGEKRLKNIATPVRVYAVTETPEVIFRGERRQLGNLPVIAFVFALVLAGLVTWFWLRPDFSPVDPSEMALELPKNPSIAVLPYELRGEVGDNGWVADGVTDSIIATLSLAPELIVIGRSTMVGYKNRQVSAADVAQDLGVRYVLSGSVTVQGERIRVATELSDAVAGNVVWSVQEDRAVGNLMTLQDEISERVFKALSIALTEGAGARNWIELSGGLQNYVDVIRGRTEFQKFSPEGHANAERIWGAMYQQFPDEAFINYLMGYIFWQKVGLGLSQDPETDWQEARRLALRALEIEEFGEGYTLLAWMALNERNHEEAIRYADKALALSPGTGDANSLAGAVKAASGQPLEGLRHMELGMRLEPDYPDWVPAQVVFARLELGFYDEAQELALAVVSSSVEDVRAKPSALAALTALEVFSGNMEEARRWAGELIAAFPQSSAKYARQSRRYYLNQEFVEKYIAALVAAGIPAE